MGGVLMNIIQRLIAKIPSPGYTATQEQLQANKRLVEEFYNTTGLAKAALIHKDYIQHDPAFIKRAEAKNISDYDEIIDFIKEAAAATPSVPDDRQLEILIAECDIVAAVIKTNQNRPGSQLLLRAERMTYLDLMFFVSRMASCLNTGMVSISHYQSLDAGDDRSLEV